MRYTLNAAADINGFVPESCEMFSRDQILNKGAAVTVNGGKMILEWAKTKLCPMLGD